MSAPTYFETRREAVQQLVLPALGRHAHCFDVEAIASEVLTAGTVAGLGYHCWQAAAPDEFWAAVARHELPVEVEVAR